MRFEIKEPGRAKVYSKTAYSILNEEGERYAAYATYYDKFHDINYIDGNLFDASGKTLKNVKKKDIEDLSGNDDESLMVDTRFKVHNFFIIAVILTPWNMKKKTISMACLIFPTGRHSKAIF